MLLMIRCDDRCSVHNSLRRSVRGLLQARGTRGEDILTTQFNLSPDRPKRALDGAFENVNMHR
jgi:hypothetical protein